MHRGYRLNLRMEIARMVFPFRPWRRKAQYRSVQQRILEKVHRDYNYPSNVVSRLKTFTAFTSDAAMNHVMLLHSLPPLSEAAVE